MVALVVAGIVLASTWSGSSAWSYMQHSNEFCTSCHLMDEPFERFTMSEHSQLNCHDCHTQRITESLRQLYLWVAERPEEIGPHNPVANHVCASCHIVADPDSSWQRISATAGHRVHLESDSLPLANLQCVTCHGTEVHRFVPTRETCGQSECHASETTTVALTAMSSDTLAIHGTMCHQFTAPVDETGPLAASFGRIRPGADECQACHEMEEVIEQFDVDEVAHDGECGSCHKPHTQTEPAQAFETCSTSECHTDPAAESPFHRDEHAAVDGCQSCHEAHTWTAPIRCSACHTDIPVGVGEG
jgi:nitrate/TMAO reductase-like tetraheme cytochrome c subunit